MTDDDIKKLLVENYKLTQEVHRILAKQQKIRMWTLIIGIAVIIIPLIAGLLALPWMLNTVSSYYGGILSI
ncbi:hypothetical protein KKF61_05825 [Patescibacteria group bacterium]|nr:hypothetical protein [Patescibacteria group bacterium]MBU0964135.1 hypothetical protein [Patescibacteria group bacterium]